jgi:DNA-directed RNA polymerase subunit alpha
MKIVFESKLMVLSIQRCPLTEAAKVLIHHFMLFSDEKITLEADECTNRIV